jgi:hypothetical protein
MGAARAPRVMATLHGHNLRHGGALFANSLRWLLRPHR